MFGNFDEKMLQNINPAGPAPSSPGYDPGMASFGGPQMSQGMRALGGLPVPGLGDPMQQYDTMMLAQNLYNGGGVGWQDALKQSMGAFGFMPQQQASAPQANPGPPPGTSPKPPPGTVPPGTAPPSNPNPATQEPPPWLLPYSQTPNPFAGGL